MRRTLLVTAALLLAGCTRAPAPPAPDTAAISPVPRGSDGITPSAETTRLDAYEAVIRHLVGGERTDWATIYVQEGICENADSGPQQRGCHERFSLEDQVALAGRLADLGARVSFVEDYASLGNRIMSQRRAAVFVWMGPLVHGSAGTLEVPGSMSCGGLCGTGSTWKVVPSGSGWRVQGPADGVWIA